jgi:hypothetical protein
VFVVIVTSWNIHDILIVSYVWYYTAMLYTHPSIKIQDVPNFSYWSELQRTPSNIAIIFISNMLSEDFPVPSKIFRLNLNRELAISGIVIQQRRIASRIESSLNCWSTCRELWLTKPIATAWDMASNFKLRTVSSGRVRKLKIADTVKLMTATMAIRHDTRGTEDALKFIRCLRAL